MTTKNTSSINTPAGRVLSKLQHVQPNGTGWTARCPAHEDHHNSLSVHEGGDGRVLLKDFAGCTVEAIVSALGLTMRDLFLAQTPARRQRRPRPQDLTVEALAQAKALPVEFLHSLGVKEATNGVQITYKLQDGSLAPRQRLRTALRAKDGSRWTTGTGEIAPYGEWKLPEARQTGNLVLVEGESDCWALWYHHIPALGIPGASLAKTLKAEHLVGIKRIFVAHETDSGGNAFVANVAHRLREISWDSEAHEITMPDGLKDPADLHKANPDGFKAALQAVLDAAKPLPAPVQPEALASHTRKPDVVCLDDVLKEPVRWLREPYIPLGKLTLLAGNPGDYKTWLALVLAAMVSRGYPFPGLDDVPKEAQKPAKVVYMSAEDGLADTLRPRLEDAGADVQRIYALRGWACTVGSTTQTGTVTLADLDVLEATLQQYQPALLVVDPIQAYLGTMDMHLATEVHQVLAGLTRLAEQYQCAVLCICHLRKSLAEHPLYRLLGSIDFAAVARSVLLVGRDPKQPSQRVLVHVKSSLALAGPSLGFEVRQGQFRWIGVSPLTAEDLLAPVPHQRQDSALETAMTFLREALAHGPRPGEEIRQAAQDAGIAGRTLERAKQALGVWSKPQGEAGKRGSGTWYWGRDLVRQEGFSPPNGEVGGLNQNLVLDEPEIKSANSVLGGLNQDGGLTPDKGANGRERFRL